MRIEIAHFRPVTRDEAYAVLVGREDAVASFLIQRGLVFPV
jgi:hypothetical protein